MSASFSSKLLIVLVFALVAFNGVNSLNAALSAAPSLGANLITNLLGILPLNLAAGASVPIGLTLDAPALLA